MSSPPDSPSIPFKKVIEYSYLFKHSINRLWVILRDAGATSLLLPEHHFPLIITKGKETWSIGTEFYGKTTEFGEYFGKVTKVKNFPQHKKLTWDLTCPSKMMPFRFETHLYKVEEEEESTVILQKLTFFEQNSYSYFIERQHAYEKMISDLHSKINVMLEQSSLNLFQYEGGVIYSSIEKIWELITDLTKLKKIAPLIKLDCDNSDNNYSQTVGEEVKLSVDNHKGYYIVKTLKFDRRPNWNKWIFCYSVSPGVPKIPKQIVYISLSKISENECQVSFFHDFKEFGSNDYIKALTNQKKYVIKSIKDYLENYN